MRTITVILYFIFAIVFLASIGVSLPFLFDSINNEDNIIKNFNQNIVTYFIAILISASLDIVMRLIDGNASYKKPAIIFICIVNTIVLLFSSYILYNNAKDGTNSVSYLAVLGIILAYIMWWIANAKNSAFNVNSTLGGNVDNPLQNGK